MLLTGKHVKCWKLAECLSAWLTEAYTEQCKQLISQNSILAGSLINLSGKAELNNSYRIKYLWQCDKTIKIQADSIPLTKTLWHSPSSFSQPTITKAEFALLIGCNPGLALLLVLGFPPQCLSLLFCLNIWVTFGAQTNHSDVCKQRQTYTIITTSKSCSNTWKKAKRADVYFTWIRVF